MKTHLIACFVATAMSPLLATSSVQSQSTPVQKSTVGQSSASSPKATTEIKAAYEEARRRIGLQHARLVGAARRESEALQDQVGRADEQITALKQATGTLAAKIARGATDAKAHLAQLAAELETLGQQKLGLQERAKAKQRAFHSFEALYRKKVGEMEEEAARKRHEEALALAQKLAKELADYWMP